jgi:flagellar biosynthesis/type III secretory pathway chaperone
MTTIAELHEVIATEAQLTEGLAAILRQQQEAIIHNRAEDLNLLLERSEEMIQPIQALEKERLRLATLVAGGTGEDASQMGQEVSYTDIISRLPAKDAESITAVIERLRMASREVLNVNQLNKPLLEHAQYFIKQTLRAATDDYKKNLIDKKM